MMSYNVNSAMVAVVDFIASYDRIASRAYLDSSQSIAMNVVLFYQTLSIAKDVDSTLVTAVDLVFPSQTKTTSH